MDGNIVLKGCYRIRLCDAKLREQIERDCPDLSWEERVAATCVYDHGWQDNVVTDLGRRRLISNTWTTFAKVFISEATGISNVRRTSMPWVYSAGEQFVTPSVNDFDRPTLLQTRTATFNAAGISRNINTVGLTGISALTNNTIHGIVAFSTLSSTVVQGAAQTADVQYRVTWSLD